MHALFVNQVITTCVESLRAWVPAFAGMTRKKEACVSPFAGMTGKTGQPRRSARVHRAMRGRRPCATHEDSS